MDRSPVTDPPAAGPRDPIRVLYADDDEPMRGLVRESLEELGMSVELATDGRQARHLASTTSPDVIVTDLRMPYGGLDYVARLREAAPGIPVIVVTAFGDASLRSDAAELGVVSTLAKPVRMRELAEAVRQAAHR
jgi:DNA-binding response OmpR family regulator